MIGVEYILASIYSFWYIHTGIMKIKYNIVIFFPYEQSRESNIAMPQRVNRLVVKIGTESSVKI